MNSQVDERLMEVTQAPRWQCGVLTLIVLGLFGPGCTNRQLQTSAARQARTVVDLEYQQILDNLAMFSLNRDAMPSLAMLKTGATQVGDTGSIGFVGTAGLATRFGSSPTLSGTRTIVDQWGSSPMTDDNNLMLVRKAFRCALGYKDLIGEDDANDLAHDLSAQIGTTSDMSVDQDTLGRIYSQDLVADTMKNLKALEVAKTPEIQRLEDARHQISELEQQLRTMADGNIRNQIEANLIFERQNYENAIIKVTSEDLQIRLERLSTHLAAARETIGRDFTDTMDPEILAMSYAFDFRRRIDVLFLLNGRYMPQDVIIAMQGRFRGERCKDKLVVAEVAGGFEAQLFNHKGEKEGPCIPINQPNTDEFRQFRDIAAELWNPPYLEADENRQILETVVTILGLKPRLRKRFEPLGDSATGLAKEAIYRVNDAQKTLDEINPGWFRRGPEKPKDACYFGHATFCGQECYVWVCRDGLDDLEEFTRKVLKLGTTLKDVQVVTAPSGIQFAPALTNPGR